MKLTAVEQSNPLRVTIATDVPIHTQGSWQNYLMHANFVAKSTCDGIIITHNMEKSQISFNLRKTNFTKMFSKKMAAKLRFHFTTPTMLRINFKQRTK